jgi:hypothetical protein
VLHPRKAGHRYSVVCTSYTVEEAKIEWCSRRPAKTADWGARDVGDGEGPNTKRGAKPAANPSRPSEEKSRWYCRGMLLPGLPACRPLIDHGRATTAMIAGVWCHLLLLCRWKMLRLGKCNTAGTGRGGVHRKHRSEEDQGSGGASRGCGAAHPYPLCHSPTQRQSLRALGGVGHFLPRGGTIRRATTQTASANHKPHPGPSRLLGAMWTEGGGGLL